MTDLEGFAMHAGRAARRVRDQDLVSNQDPVWILPEDAWTEWSKAVLKVPTAELKACFLAGWFDSTPD